MNDNSDDRRLASYFLRRAVDMIEDARAETDPVRRLDLEKRISDYWRIAKTAG